MADRAKKISELTAANSIANSDLFVVVTNTAGSAVTKSSNLAVLSATLGLILVAAANTRTVTDGIAYTSAGLTYSSNNITYSANAINLANSISISFNGVRVFGGSANTRASVNTQVGSIGSNGSLYLSTSGKMFLKVDSTGVGETDWQRVTTAAAD